MSARIDITGKTYVNIKVIEYSHTKGTHAYWKAQCLLCDNIFTITYSNLQYGGTKACAGCTHIGLTREVRDDIMKRLTDKEKITSIARHYGIGRRKIYSLKAKMAALFN